MADHNNSKRKVSFPSPRNEIFLFDPASAPMKPLRIGSHVELPQQGDKTKQRKIKKIYIKNKTKSSKLKKLLKKKR